MSKPDPIDALAVGLAADHQAEKKNPRKPTAKQIAAEKAKEAENAATEAGSPSDDAAALGEVVGEKVEEAVDTTAPEAPAVETPAAPGDEPETVFERRLARLTTMVSEAQFEGGTAFGDLRDCVLDLFKHRPKLWSAMPPSEQQDVIRHVEALSKQILEKVILVIAQEDDVTIQATMLAGFSVKGETIEAKIKIDHVDDESVLDIFRLAGHKVVVIDAASKRFMSTRRNIDPGSDQLGMTFADGATVASAKPHDAPLAAPKPKPEVSDDALADGDDTESGVELAKAGAEPWERGTVKGSEGDGAAVDKPFGVFDTTDAEWLKGLGVGEASDDWTGDTAEALAMTGEEADKLASEYGDGFEARRFDDDGGESQRTHGDDSAVDDEPAAD